MRKKGISTGYVLLIIIGAIYSVLGNIFDYIKNNKNEFFYAFVIILLVFFIIPLSYKEISREINIRSNNKKHMVNKPVQEVIYNKEKEDNLRKNILIYIEKYHKKILMDFNRSEDDDFLCFLKNAICTRFCGYPDIYIKNVCTHDFLNDISDLIKSNNFKNTEKTFISYEDALRQRIVLFVEKDKKRIVRDFSSSGDRNFINFLKNTIQIQFYGNPKDYIDNICHESFLKELCNMIKSDKDTNYILDSCFDMKKLQTKYRDINIGHVNDIRSVINLTHFERGISNGSLIQPLYYINDFDKLNTDDMYVLQCMYEELLDKLKLHYEDSICADNFEEIESQLDAYILNINETITNYLRLVLAVTKNKKSVLDFVLIPYKKVFIENKFSYDIKEPTFLNTEEDDYPQKQLNDEKVRNIKEEAINKAKIIIDAIVQKREEIKSIVDNYDKNINTEAYFTLMMKYMFIPYWFFSSYDFLVKFEEESRLLCIEVQLPSEESLPKVIGIKNILKKNFEIKYKTYSNNQIIKVYNDFIYQYILSTLHFILHFDYNKQINAICINGIKSYIDKKDGILKENCVLTIHTTRESFEKINLACVDAKSCFKTLKGVSGVDFVNVTPVVPLLQFDKKDKRFVEGYDVATQLNEATNLASMNWQDFENLIRDIFEKEFAKDGGDVKVTQASHDGGVDAIAFDPDPIRGGKIVIQAKRYTNVVGVSAVRDLYGTVLNEGATKGILVTTSNFGPDAHEFAKNKPITLLSGNNLLYLLEKHGYKAKIDIKEARKILGLAEKVRSN